MRKKNGPICSHSKNQKFGPDFFFRICETTRNLLFHIYTLPRTFDSGGTHGAGYRRAIWPVSAKVKYRSLSACVHVNMRVYLQSLYHHLDFQSHHETPLQHFQHAGPGTPWYVYVYDDTCRCTCTCNKHRLHHDGDTTLLISSFVKIPSFTTAGLRRSDSNRKAPKYVDTHMHMCMGPYSDPHVDALWVSM